MTRRQILAAPLAAAAFRASAQPSPRFTKGICSIIFSKEMPRSECFAQAKSAGFDAIEVAIGTDLSLDISHDDARRMADAADKSGIRIATLWVSEPLHQNPLNAADPAVRARGVEAIRRAIAISTDLNCGAILLYAVRLGDGATLEYGSQETWDRMTAELTKVVPDAERRVADLTRHLLAGHLSDLEPGKYRVILGMPSRPIFSIVPGSSLLTP